jgi:Ribbon-helix-helix protein, copG family
MLLCMRTTLQIDDQLMKAAKKAAAESGRTLTSIIEDALRLALFNGKNGTESKPFRLPVFSMGPPLPGVNLDSNAELLELMEADDDPV